MGIAGGTWLLIAATLLVVLLRRALLARRTVTATVTWDCGYARPTARMQYTASGFTQPFIEPLARVTGTERHAQLPTTLFPTTARYATHTPDTFRARVFTPLLRAGIRMAQPLQRLQHGNVQLYILYIAVTLIVLLLFFI
jgi:hypothetical protein